MTSFSQKNCDQRHTVCLNNLNYLKNISTNLNSLNFDKFINGIAGSGGYYNCLSYSNKNNEQLLNFIVQESVNYVIQPEKLTILSQFITDDKLLSIILNQVKINPAYKKQLSTCQTQKGPYDAHLNFNWICVATKKVKTFGYMLEDVHPTEFIALATKMKHSAISAEFDKYFCDYINKHKEYIVKEKYYSALFDSFLNKSKILKSVFNIMSGSIAQKEKLEILNKVLLANSLDPYLILNILEGNDIVPNEASLTHLLSKAYFTTKGYPNAKIIAEIIDMFILYGFKITKEIVISLLKKGCYVNSIEKYQITIDNSILEECAELGYYPYDFSCTPSHKMMIRECKREGNLEQIKRLKEKGGVITVECLEEACGVRKNAKVIKYIISECNIKPNDTCLQKFQLAYGLEALDLIMKNYKDTKEQKITKNNKLTLDLGSTMIIDKREIEINTDFDYTLKNKIKKLLDYKKKTIKYVDLYELMLKYLIDHNLVIGNYFVINDELCNLLKINQCTVINIDQLDNMLSYFIDTS
jgi:hypothetical protein